MRAGAVSRLQDALAEAFEVDTAALTLALDTISLLLETIAYHQLDPNAVLKHTQAIGLGEGQVSPGLSPLPTQPPPRPMGTAALARSPSLLPTGPHAPLFPQSCVTTVDDFRKGVGRTRAESDQESVISLTLRLIFDYGLLLLLRMYVGAARTV